MNYTEAKLGRIFILRLHHGEVLHETLESFAAEKQIQSGLCFFLGGAQDQSKVVVGPKDGAAIPPDPMVTLLRGVYEACGVGTISRMSKGSQSCICMQVLEETIIQLLAASEWVWMFGVLGK